MLFKVGFEPASARPRDGAGVTVMPLGTVAAKSVSIFDDESDDREHNDHKKLASRGTSRFACAACAHSRSPLLHSACPAAPKEI